DRPLQLDGMLRSFARHCRDAPNVRLHVLYTVSSDCQESLYQQVRREHSQTQFVRERCFRRDLLRLLKTGPYVLFLVDDCIVVREFSLAQLTGLLDQHPDALGFSLRLGRNTTYCYSLNQPQQPPEFEIISRDVLKYRWTDAPCDFGYPLEVSSSIYRAAEIRSLLQTLEFSNPNTLELAMARNANRFRWSHPALLCPPQSLAFCATVNKVQTVENNRAGRQSAYSAESLSELFVQGRRLDLDPFTNFTPCACHHEVPFSFVPAINPTPVVSVVIPCYQQARFLPEAVKSVVEQSYTDWELIIVNDGSPDNTSVVARKLIARYPDRRIRLLEKTNGGLSDARNAGIRAGLGRYVLPLDADDRIAPPFLGQAVAMLDARPEIGFVYSHIQHSGAQNNLHRLPQFDADTIVHTDNVACVCALIRRATWEAVGGYNTAMREGYEDWDFWVGCIQQGWQGYRIPAPLFLYRKSARTMLHSANEKRERLIAQIVLNHPTLYSEARRRRAQQLLQGATPVTPPQRVLLVCTHFWPSVGGLETVVEELGNRLVRRGSSVTVATLRHRQRSCPYHRGMPIISLDSARQRGRDLPIAARELRELVLSGQFDACVLLADPLNWIFRALEDLPATNNTRLIGQPIINADGFAQWCDDREFRRRLAVILRKLNVVVAMSSNGQEVQFLREEKIPFVYLPNATAPIPPGLSFRQHFGIADDERLLLHVANLWPVKNHLGLMQTMSRLPGEWRLAMIGHPTADAAYAEEVRASARRDKRFLLIPGLPRADVAAAMAAADMVVLASVGDASPVTILEAMSHGKPWLATPACGAVHDNAGGVIAPLEQFPSVLQKLTNRPDLLRELGRLGQQHWQSSFSWDTVITGWEEVLATGQTTISFAMPEAVRNGMFGVQQELATTVAPMEVASAVPPPKVSVIVPTYNRPTMLAEALRSILNQTFLDFEIIVVNDAGTDVAGVIAALNAGNRIQQVRHPVNRDRAAARNTGLRAARGKYIAYLDDDDIFHPDHLQTLVKYLDAHPSTVAYTDACRAQQQWVDGRYESVARDVPYSADWDNDRILVRNLVPILCVMHEAACIEKTGFFDESLTTHEDWDFWIRLSRHFPFHHLKQMTCEFRARVDGSTASSGRRADFLRTTRVIFDKHRTHADGRRAIIRAQQKCLRRLEREVGCTTRPPQWSLRQLWARIRGRRR
ncbi:MAG: glycosyltransferase, partial [Verrucomicrobia bacterium]|nr:glycosyltransferase [Verrucomicrobiota bacterium]